MARIQHARMLLAAILVLGVAASESRAQLRPDPNSPRAKAVAALREFLGSSGEKAIADFIEAHCAPSLRGDDEAALRSQLSALRDACAGAPPRGVRPVGPFGAELFLGAANARQSRAIAIAIEPEAPHRFVRLDLVEGASQRPDQPFGPRPSRLPTSDADIASILEAHLAELASRDEFSGAVLVAKGDKVLFEKAYGLANKNYDAPNHVDTLFRLGSMNKMFTGLAVCQLAEQGLLDFDDTLAEHLHDYPNREFAERTTIHQLLTHTSGLGDFRTGSNLAAVNQARSVDDYVAAFADAPIPFDPQSGFHYSNAGAILAGKVVEQVSGQNYFDYVRDHIYVPAGMLRSDSYETDQVVDDIAMGYIRSGGRGAGNQDAAWKSNVLIHGVKGSPAGGGYSTVRDMHRFALALMGNSLLGEAYTKTLLDGKVEMGPNGSYAYLFGDSREGGHRWCGHNGGAPGVNAVFAFNPESQYCVVVLANYDAAAAPVARFAQALIAHRLSEAGAEAQK